MRCKALYQPLWRFPTPHNTWCCDVGKYGESGALALCVHVWVQADMHFSEHRFSGPYLNPKVLSSVILSWSNSHGCHFSSFDLNQLFWHPECQISWQWKRMIVSQHIYIALYQGRMVGLEMSGRRQPDSWFTVNAQSLACCMTLRKALHFSGPQFRHS